MSPPTARVRRAGDQQPREGGIRTCLVSPQAPRASSVSPSSRAREGKGREKGEATGRWVFPNLPQEELGLWGYSLSAFSSVGSSYPLRKRKLLPTRVAPTWGLPHP